MNMNIQEKQLAAELKARKMKRMHEYACAAMANRNVLTTREAWTVAEALEKEFQTRFPDAEQAPHVKL